jgi:RHS repeat-associated protein
MNGKVTTFSDTSDTDTNAGARGKLWKRTPDASLGEPAVEITYYSATNLGSGQIFGLKATETYGNVRTTYQYDAWGRTWKVTTQYLSGNTVTYSHALEYGYDIAGNKTLSRLWPQGSASGIATTYSYDANGRMQYVFHPDGERTEYTYTNVGSVSSVSRRKSGGTGAVIASTGYTYNAKSFLTRVEHKNASGVVTLALDYVVDTSGKRTQMTETRLGQASQVTNYVYDAAGRLTSETVVGVRTTVFVYDKVGNRTSQSVTPAGGSTTSQSYSYDANDRLVSDGPYTYGYNAKGELTSRSQVGLGPVDEYAYTFEGRLSVQRHRASPMVAPTRQTLYSYDASGNRVGLTHQMSSNGTTWSTVDSTTFLVDVMQPYAEVVGEWDEVNVPLRAYYDIGLDRLRVVRDNAPANGPPSWASRWYLLDGLGSTRSLVDDSGIVQDGYRYDAFGTPTILSGGSGFANAFLFNGQQWDDAVGGGAGAGFTEGIYFLRARYYNSSTGRFLSQDPFLGEDERPNSLQRYRYAANDPVGFSDNGGEDESLSTQVGATLPGSATVAAANIGQIQALTAAETAIGSAVAAEESLVVGELIAQSSGSIWLPVSGISASVAILSGARWITQNSSGLITEFVISHTQEMLDWPRQDNSLWTSEGDGDSARLQRRMIRVGNSKPGNNGGYAAHHIVMKKDPQGANGGQWVLKSRKILERFGITVDDPANGVWLRTSTGSGTLHSTRRGHIQLYGRFVFPCIFDR